MRTLTSILILAGLGLAAAVPAEPALAAGQATQDSAVSAGPVVHDVQPASLAGLWSLSLASDLAWTSGQDLLSFYPAGTLGAPGNPVFPGFSLALRRHLSDSFFAGLNLASLPKGYSMSVGADSDTWTLDGLWLGGSLGWMLYRAVSVGVYAEGHAAWLGLADGAFERSGPGADKGALEGSGLAEQFNLGALWFILPSVALEAQGGYRFARLSVSLKTGKPWTPPNGPDYYVDYSGGFARLGLSFFWGLRNPWGEQAAPAAPPPPSNP